MRNLKEGIETTPTVMDVEETAVMVQVDLLGQETRTPAIKIDGRDPKAGMETDQVVVVLSGLAVVVVAKVVVKDTQHEAVMTVEVDAVDLRAEPKDVVFKDEVNIETGRVAVAKRY